MMKLSRKQLRAICESLIVEQGDTSAMLDHIDAAFTYLRKASGIAKQEGHKPIVKKLEAAQDELIDIEEMLK